MKRHASFRDPKGDPVAKWLAIALVVVLVVGAIGILALYAMTRGAEGPVQGTGGARNSELFSGRLRPARLPLCLVCAVSSTFCSTVDGGRTEAEAKLSTVILIVEDEPGIRAAVRNALGNDENRYIEAGTATDGIDLAAAEQPALIVLDLGLPDGSGFRVCREVRQWSTASIVVLSAHHSESEKVALLEAGADDYVMKPFSPAEFRARVHAQLRRARMRELPGETGVVRIGALEIDAAAQVVRRDGRDIHLTPTEWDLLRAFVRNAGRTLTHEQIFRAVWPAAVGDAQQYLRVYVARLRRKIESDPTRPSLILTEMGVGYRFVALV